MSGLAGGEGLGTRTRTAEGCEVEPGAGEGPVEEAGPVLLHPFQPGLHQRGQLAEVAFGQVGQGPLEVRPHQL
jgi:hypothetical protein